MTGIVEDILSITDDLLGLRDELGATKHLVYIVTRTWAGDRVGRGEKTDVAVQILPTPFLVDYSHSLKLQEGGKVKQGDVFAKHISKQSYPNESDIDCSSSAKNIEKFYKIDNRLYNVIYVKSDYVYWNIQLRKTNERL